MTRENRQVARIPLEKLPEALQSFYVSQGFGSSFKVDTYDASTTGLGVVAMNPPHPFVIGDHVILHTSDDKVKLVGEVIYAVQKSNVEQRVGLQFRKMRSLKHYQEILGV